MSNMNQCKPQCKRERVRESGSNANTRICFEIRAHSSTSPPSHRRISTNSSTQDFPHREPPLRIWGTYNLGVHNSSLKYNLSLKARHNSKTPLHLEGQALSQTTNRPLTRGIRHKANTNNNHLTLEGFQHNLHLSLGGYKYHFHNHLSLRGISILSPLTRGISQRWKVYNLVV